MFVCTDLSLTMRPVNMLNTSNMKGVLSLSVEPVTAAIAAYLVTEGPRFARVVQRRRCRWFLRRHKDEFESALVRETTDSLLHMLNLLLPSNILHVSILGFLLIVCIALYAF